MPPFVAYPVFGILFNSNGDISPNADIEIVTSTGKNYKKSDSDGLFLFDLAEKGYVSGETVKMNITSEFDNQLKEHEFDVTGFFNNEDITLSIRTLPPRNITDYPVKAIIHKVGLKPVTSDNPFPIFDETHPLKSYILSGGDSSNRIFGYVKKNGEWYIQKFTKADKTYKYVRGTTDFESSWSNRTNLSYQFANEVF